MSFQFTVSNLLRMVRTLQRNGDPMAFVNTVHVLYWMPCKGCHCLVYTTPEACAKPHCYVRDVWRHKVIFLYVCPCLRSRAERCWEHFHPLVLFPPCNNNIFGIPSRSIPYSSTVRDCFVQMWYHYLYRDLWRRKEMYYCDIWDIWRFKGTRVFVDRVWTFHVSWRGADTYGMRDVTTGLVLLWFQRKVYVSLYMWL